MQTWMIYAITAGAAYGLSPIPLKFAVSRYPASSQAALLLSSALGALIGISGFLFLKRPVSLSADRYAMLLSALSGLIGAAGSIAIIKALSCPNSNTTGVVSLVNTNAFFTMIFAALLLGESHKSTDLGRLLIGTFFIFAGSFFICWPGK